MPNAPDSRYHRWVIALDDAIIALRDVLEEPGPMLPNRLRDRVTAIVEEMEDMQETLEHAPADVARESNDDDLLATMDDIARPSS